MEVPERTCPASPARDQPAPAPGPPGAPGGQASPHLTLGPVILPREQGLAPTVFLKALPIPLYHTVPPGGLQPRAPLVTGSLDGGSVPFILSPLLPPEGPGPTQIRKPATPTLTVNIVGALPVLSPAPGPALGGLGKARNVGKHLCPHCGRDCLKPSVLEKHIRSHTGERPFPCATCGIAFKTQSNLYKHRRTQTHLNNSRLSSESEDAGPSLLADQAGQASRTTGKGDSCSLGGGGGAPSERPLSPGVQGAGHCAVPPVHLCPVAKNLDPKLDAACCPGSTLADREAPLDSPHMAAAGPPAAGSQPRHKLSEQKSPAGRACSLQQQQVTPSEKPWDTKAAEGRLRKCESTDSGYLSRSDSSEQPLAACSPLHSLSEHSAESEGEGAPGPGGAKAELGGQGPGLELEKRRLEERIARLISHNQAVVDDPRLDHVRPRKTVLSKQGSVDLPVPYTYKDSFHFEIRALGPGRRRRQGALCPARSACTALGEARPLFFHSVPTQLSTTVECVPVTRSNSLPFVEGTRTWQEPLGPRDIGPGRQKPLSPRPAPARLVDSPSGHPRALVRQVAVEDLLCPPTEDASAPAEDLRGKRAVAGEGAASKGRAARQTPSQRRPRVFSQEKWQMYGNETFQKAYGKVRTSPQGGRKARAGRVGCETPLHLPLPEEGSGAEGAAPSRSPSQDRKTPVCGDASVGTKPGPWGSPPATEDFLVTESPGQRDTVAGAGGSDQPRVSRPTSPPTLRGREPPPLGHKSPVLPPNGRLELGCQLPPAPGPPKEGDLEAPRLEAGAWDIGDTKEPCQRALTVPREPSSGSGEPEPGEDTLPWERKTLCCPESGLLGAGGQTPGGPAQAASPPSWAKDSDNGGGPGVLPGSAGRTEQGRARPWEASASPGALRLAGPRTEEPVPGPAARAPGGPSVAPGASPALTDPAFPPKYLLRLPQGEAPPPPGAQGPGPSQDPLCGSRQPEDPASSVGSALGTLLPPRPAAGLASGGADFREDPSWSRPWVRSKGVLGDEKGDLGTGTPAARECLGSSAGAPWDTASVLLTRTCDSQRSGTRDTGHLCADNTWTRARPSGGGLNPWTLNRDVAGPPGNAPEDAPPGPQAGHSPCGSLPALGWPARGSCAHSESPGGFGPQGPFPVLKAEPRLTWCCLGRSVPLPRPGDSALEGAGAWRVSKAASGQCTGTRPAEGGDARPWKLSYPTAPGMTSRDPGSEPGCRRGPPWRRKPFRGTSRQNTRRRCRGSFQQGRLQLRGSRRRRPLRVLRKDRRPPPLEGLDPRRTLGQASSDMAGLRLQGEPPRATPASRGCGTGEEEEEEDRRPMAEGSCPGASPRTVRERRAWPLKGLLPSAGEHGDGHPQSTVVGPGWSLPADHCIQEASNSPLSCGKGLGVGLPETQRLPFQGQVDPKPCALSNAREPSSSESKGRSPGHDVAMSVSAVGPSLGAGGGPTALGTPGAEPQDHGRVAGGPQTQSSLDRKAVAIAQGTSPSPSPGKPSLGQRPPGSVPLRSPRKAHLEIPASGPGPASSPQEEGMPKSPFPPGGPQGCGQVPVPCPPLGKDREECQESGSVALKDGAVPSAAKGSTPELYPRGAVPSELGQPMEVPEAPAKATKRRSLEGMRKQTRVEFSDTSSDDEDRLVIEI
uniref:Zinc finger protein 831 n=1 Tax=Molossus molossus TaxID=27622 RepID=A0A7J8HLH7_MOLMO|nr:zinc finger protein 831 [Molossus molossus]